MDKRFTVSNTEDFAMSCMTAVVGKAASVTGRVMVAHNEDDGGRTRVNHAYVPAADWTKGEILPAEPGLAGIGQASRTLGYYWSEVVGEAGGLTGADVFYNEKGVCVVSNNASGSRELQTDETRLTDGGIGYNLRRIVAERARCAREALEIVISLVEKWGYAPSGRIYTVADADEAFMIQIVRGHHYVAARVPDDAIAVMPNHYTFHTLNDVPGMMYSPDLVAYAREMGWSAPGEEFDFARDYQAPTAYRTPVNVLRQKYGTERLLGREWDAEKEGFPFCVRAERPVSERDLMDFLSLHYEGTEHDVRVGPGGVPHATGVRRICDSTTIEATVFALAETPAQTVAWIACGHPCQLPFVPFFPICGIPAGFSRLEDPMVARGAHLSRQPGQLSHTSDFWQKARDFEHLQEMLYEETMPDWRIVKRSLEADFFARGREADSLDQRLALSEACLNLAAKAMDDFAAARFRRVCIRPIPPVRLPEADSTADAAPGLPEAAPITVAFSCPSAPDADSIIFGMGGLKFSDRYVRPVSLKIRADGLYEAQFPPTTIIPGVGAGRYEYFLGGKTSEGQPFAGMTEIEFTAPSL